MTIDISEFYQTFFDEADELLADMEQHLLALDPERPEVESLHAIFRVAHSIKGGAGTFGFSALQETTHILENVLDNARSGTLSLNADIINLFLDAKDIMQQQLEAHKQSREPDEESYRWICDALRKLASPQQAASEALPAAAPAANDLPRSSEQTLRIRLTGLKPGEGELMSAELANLGNVIGSDEHDDAIEIQLETAVAQDDIAAVLCFILEPEQITFVAPPHLVAVAEPEPAESDAPPGAAATAMDSPVRPAPVARSAESSSIRVAVEKVDRLINLVGELVITQSMLAQRSGDLDPALHGELLASMNHLQRNARDLQESVMSIRMMPMDYVFSRFPRLVRDLATRLGKQVNLNLVGSAAELDKSLIERIIDPLTHLVRNSLDHGIEQPQVRLAAGKPEVGTLTLAASHQGGNICLSVSDDGAGLNYPRIIARARERGLIGTENISDQEAGMLIFAPGFSTADQVTDVSGRGVGMDVVRRNIEEMGGHVELESVQGQGATVRILLPLTLAILDGMTVEVGGEVFILPLNAVMESLQPQPQALRSLAGGEQMLEVRGEYLPLISLAEVFAVNAEYDESATGIAVILQSGSRRYALRVDSLIGQHQVVVKNLETNYRKVPGISAATILGDGSVALIVDIAALPRLDREQRRQAFCA